MNDANTRFPAREQAPRRVTLPEGVLVLPPVSIKNLPPGGAIGTFLGIAALRFSIHSQPHAVFLHDLAIGEIETLLEGQRREAESQLGRDYARRPLWWEKAT